MQIPDEIAESLALGNNFDVPYNTNEIPVNNIVASFENCIKKLDEDEDKLKIRRTLTEIISNHNRNNKFKNNSKTHDSLVNFQNNHKDLIFVKADKGNIMVGANKVDYNNTIENNLEKNNLYKNVKTDIVPTDENKCNDIVSRWGKKGYITRGSNVPALTHRWRC